MQQRNVGSAELGRQTTGRKEGEIGVELHGVAREDVGRQPRESVDLSARAQEGEIFGEETRALAQHRIEQAGVGQRLQIGAQGRLIERGVGARQTAAGEEGEIVAQRGLVLCGESQPAIGEEGLDQRTIDRAQLHHQPAVAQEGDGLRQRRLARAGEGGRIAAAAHEGEIGDGEIGEGAREGIAVAAAGEEVQIGLGQHAVARGEVCERSRAPDIGEVGLDIARARRGKAARQPPRTDQIEVVDDEAAIGGEEAVARTAPRQKAQIGADDVGLRLRERGAAIGPFELRGGCHQQREIAAREGVERRIANHRLDPACCGDDVARCAGGGELVAEAHRNAVDRGRDRTGIAADRHDGIVAGDRGNAGRRNAGWLRPPRQAGIVAIAAAALDRLHLRFVGDDALRPALAARAPHLARLEALQLARPPDPHRTGQRMAACLAIGTDNEIARRTGAANTAFEALGHPHHHLARSA